MINITNCCITKLMNESNCILILTFNGDIILFNGREFSIVNAAKYSRKNIPWQLCSSTYASSSLQMSQILLCMLIWYLKYLNWYKYNCLNPIAFFLIHFIVGGNFKSFWKYNFYWHEKDVIKIYTSGIVIT